MGVWVWLPPALFCAAIVLAWLALRLRRHDRRASHGALAERATARDRGSDKARLQHPHVDLDRCIGCGACVDACPEEGVLAMAHGQALVAHGARCVGHARCADACPVGAVAVRLADVHDRDDLPALTAELEAVGVPGLFVAGELSGYALVRTAVAHGVAVADHVAARSRVPVPVAARGSHGDARPPLDLLVVGAGPAGLACSLRAREHGLRFATIEQSGAIGGAVAGYPRRKLVMTQPMELPLVGRLARLDYEKEELVEIWESAAREHRLPIRTGVGLAGLERRDDVFVARTTAGKVIRARHVCLALGRRGTPRRLGIPGEDSTRVSYALHDAAAWTASHVLVVGGGDSAVEAALALAMQPGNTVTLSYRKSEFFRLKARNDAAIRDAAAAGRVRVAFESTPIAVRDGEVELAVTREGEPHNVVTLPNDAVFVFAGGEPPFGLLRDAGVSFDPTDHPPARLGDGAQQRGLSRALQLTALCSAAALGLVLARHDYFALPAAERARDAAHDLLRPGGPLGLTLGGIACAMIAANLAYLARRAPRLGRLVPGSLRAWMDAHVTTGLLALLAAAVHAGFAPADTVGGHALIAMTVVVAAGAVGRWLYASLPRATNGRALELEEVRTRLSALSGEWDRDARGFGAMVRSRVEELVERDRASWRRGLPARVAAVLRSRRDLAALEREVRHAAHREGVPADELHAVLALARRAHGLLLGVTHFDELRAILASWRFVHRWLALLLVALVVLHVRAALRWAQLDWGVLGDWLGGGR